MAGKPQRKSRKKSVRKATQSKRKSRVRSGQKKRSVVKRKSVRKVLSVRKVKSVKRRVVYSPLYLHVSPRKQVVRHVYYRMNPLKVLYETMVPKGITGPVTVPTPPPLPLPPRNAKDDKFLNELRKRKVLLRPL